MCTQSRYQRGSSMFEVLVTMVILMIGLLGLAQLQSKLQVSDIEAYQRSQALVLLNDMANRISSNRANAASYVTTSPLGAGMTCPTTSVSSTLQQVDSAEWCNALQGAGETVVGTTTTRVGAMTDGRGCVQSLGSGEYLITVAWQGMGPIAAPPATVTCGLNLYNGATGSVCSNDLCRRVVTTVVRIATL